jgi:hypothetical protein
VFPQTVLGEVVYRVPVPEGRAAPLARPRRIPTTVQGV